MKNREHLTLEGLTKIVKIKASLNLDLSPQLKEYFPEIALAHIPRPPLDSNQKISDPFWLAGFTSAEGCFFINLHKVTDRKLNERVKLGFKLIQHSRDEQLMKNLIEFLGCGNLFRKGDAFDLTITKFSNTIDKVIPFFEKFPIQGVKFIDYIDWFKVAKLMENKSHLILEGLNIIRDIKIGMNKGRKFS